MYISVEHYIVGGLFFFLVYVQHLGTVAVWKDTAGGSNCSRCVCQWLHKWERECFQEASVGIHTVSVKGNKFKHLEQKMSEPDWSISEQPFSGTVPISCIC